jgi:hypothetical protein
MAMWETVFVFGDPRAFLGWPSCLGHYVCFSDLGDFWGVAGPFRTQCRVRLGSGFGYAFDSLIHCLKAK